LTATEDRELRRALRGTLQSVQPPPVPLETIIRRSNRIRLRRAGAVVATLGLAGVIAVASLASRGGQQPEVRRRAPAWRHSAATQSSARAAVSPLSMQRPT